MQAATNQWLNQSVSTDSTTKDGMQTRGRVKRG